MKHPFVKKTDSVEKIRETILSGKTNIDTIDCDSKAKHLLKKMLEVQPSERYTVDEALNHPWITGNDWLQFTGKEMMMIYTTQLDLKQIFFFVQFLAYVKTSYKKNCPKWLLLKNG